MGSLGRILQWTNMIGKGYSLHARAGMTTQVGYSEGVLLTSSFLVPLSFQSFCHISPGTSLRRVLCQVPAHQGANTVANNLLELSFCPPNGAIIDPEARNLQIPNETSVKRRQWVLQPCQERKIAIYHKESELPITSSHYIKWL